MKCALTWPQDLIYNKRTVVIALSSSTHPTDSWHHNWRIVIDSDYWGLDEVSGVYLPRPVGMVRTNVRAVWQ